MKKLLPIVLVVITVAGGAYIVLTKEEPPRPGLVKVKEYEHPGPSGITCQAVIPECGVCYGEVIEQECWVDPSMFSEAEEAVMRVR